MRWTSGFSIEDIAERLRLQTDQGLNGCQGLLNALLLDPFKIEGEHGEESPGPAHRPAGAVFLSYA
jgi:hypothetical protein